MVDGTLSFPDTSAVEGRAAPARLVRAMQWRRLLAPPLVVELARGRELVLGRGADGIDVQPARAILRTDDDRMSSDHARVALRNGRWTLTDQGSKNGSFVNGARISTAALADGDWIEIGSTMFVFRSVMPGLAVARDAVDASLEDPIPALRTARPDLAARFARLRRAAESSIPVLLLGPSGTGKELVARAVHAVSRRRGALVAVNCGALPESLIESQLFGFKKGAFSGAERDTPGLVRAANDGTLFLDEISELSERSQVTLLRVLQEQEVLPVGATEPVPVDVRVVAATHRDLRARIGEGQFREDLYARLAGMTLDLCPLCDRREDLGLITAELLRGLAGERAAELKLSRRAARALFAYDWPRNIRELRAALQLSLATGDGSSLSVEVPETAPPRAAAHVTSDAERHAALVEALRAEAGNVSAAARRLGYSRAHLNRLLKQHDIDPERFRHGS